MYWITGIMMERRKLPRMLAAVLILLLIAFLTVQPSHTAAATRTCQSHTLKVKMSPLSLTRYNLYGELCWSGQLNPRVVQVLIHGATYNRYYWDFQAYQPENYSYVDAALAR